MNNFVFMIKRNFFYFLAVTVLLVIMLSALIVLSIGRNPQEQPAAITTPTPVSANTRISPIPTGDPARGTGHELDSQPSVEEKENRPYLVMNLLGKLPYLSQRFSFDYDYDLGTFLLKYNRASLQQGQEDFKIFLGQNGVKDPSWIENIIISYQ